MSDTAKAIAAGAVYDGDPWDLCSYRNVPTAALRIFDILTLSASGSEMNGSKEYLAYSAIDIAPHCLDLYFTAAYIPEFTALKTVIRTTDILLNNPDDYEARSEFIWAAAEALNGSTRAGVEGNRFDTHLIEYSMSALYDVPHGAGLAVVLPACMNWQMPMNSVRYERFAKNKFGVQTAEEGVKAMKNWIASIGAPVTLSELNIPANDADKIAAYIFKTIELSRKQTLYPLNTLKELLSLILYRSGCYVNGPYFCGSPMQMATIQSIRLDILDKEAYL